MMCMKSYSQVLSIKKEALKRLWTISYRSRVTEKLGARLMTQDWSIGFTFGSLRFNPLDHTISLALPGVTLEECAKRSTLKQLILE